MATPIIKPTPQAQSVAAELARTGVTSVAQLLSILDEEGADAIGGSLRRAGLLADPEAEEVEAEEVDPEAPAEVEA